jgi:hypothetical protein
MLGMTSQAMGLADVTRRVISRSLARETMVHECVDDVAGNGPGRHYLPFCRMPRETRDQSTC